ncbi:hypothetical protein RRG08_035931 [Elysia crispata]|uniref:EGF-like domain-containing protein n=1 Tax=Elysia crispata TaxID=231223 RepID=A0AAE1A218_9GAST|nr:hypothetical protein RRG08_035931 [Elysia crispata]
MLSEGDRWILLSLVAVLFCADAQIPQNTADHRGNEEMLQHLDGAGKVSFGNGSVGFPVFNGDAVGQEFFPLGETETIPEDANGFLFWPEPAATNQDGDSRVISSQLAECRSEDNPCQQICYLIGLDTKICDCRPGYALLPDAKKCRDLDECVLGLCGQHGLCVNTPGSFICTCNPGFVPEADGFCNGEWFSMVSSVPLTLNLSQRKTASIMVSGFHWFHPYLNPRFDTDEDGVYNGSDFAFDVDEVESGLPALLCLTGRRLDRANHLYSSPLPDKGTVHNASIEL